MAWRIDPERVVCVRDPMIYGQFLEHFHRQIYGGVYMPGHPLSDKNGFRADVLEALRRIRTPVIRWPGGCFVSAYHWKKGVGPERVPSFDKAWRVEDDNSFGTDEFIQLCTAIGCEPYICLNAAPGDEEEMSDWVEYCNLEAEGEYARLRIANGHAAPYRVKYWSVGNENYGDWEIGAKDAVSWARLVTEASKMMKRVDPAIEISAAALPDVNWNVHLLGSAAERLGWISIHGYWDGLAQVNAPAGYEQCMAFTRDLDASVRRVRGLLNAFGLEKRIRIAFDEWNLRGWHHPNIHTVRQGATQAEYLTPRDLNDLNATYTMADAVFAACFLNMILRNADIVGMANFAPIVNTRGAIYTYDQGVVLRPTYHVFDLYTNLMGDQVLDLYGENAPYAVTDKQGCAATVDQLDIVATRHSDTGRIAVSLVNKHASAPATVTLTIPGASGPLACRTLAGRSPDDYNDVNTNTAVPYGNDQAARRCGTDENGADGRAENGRITVDLPAHSISILTVG